MAKNSSVIEYLDLDIGLPKGHSELFKSWLEEFTENHDYVEIDPRIKADALRINSTDLIAFLGYIDASKLNDLELQRLKHNAQHAFEQLLIKSTSLDHQSHYKWCITALKTFEIGRFRE